MDINVPLVLVCISLSRSISGSMPRHSVCNARTQENGCRNQEHPSNKHLALTTSLKTSWYIFYYLMKQGGQCKFPLQGPQYLCWQ